MDDEFEFHKQLNILAKICNFELDEQIIGIYDNALCSYGYSRVAKALSDVVVTRKSRDQFPSVAEVKQLLDKCVSSDTTAEDVVARILSAHSKHGYTWPDTYHYDGFKSFPSALMATCTDLGYEIITRLGGYSRLCWLMNNSDPGVVRAQLRRLALSVIEQMQNKPDDAPQLPTSNTKVIESKDRPSLAELINKISKPIDK